MDDDRDTHTMMESISVSVRLARGIGFSILVDVRLSPGGDEDEDDVLFNGVVTFVVVEDEAVVLVTAWPALRRACLKRIRG